MKHRSLIIILASVVGLSMAFLWMSGSSRAQQAPLSLDEISVGAPVTKLLRVTDRLEQLSISSDSVIINEVAWGGTAASSADEWIELYNTSETTVSLTGWRLMAADGDPDIALVGAISPHSYYLIERTDDTTVSDIPADLICPFGYGLNNAGETLLLTDAGGTLVDTVNADGGPWPNDGEGGSPEYRSMERITPLAPDLPESWISNDSTVTSGLDSLGRPLNGTPKSPNAAFLHHDHADVSVEKTCPATAVTGESFGYSIHVENTGSQLAADVVVTDVLPANLIFVGQQSEAGFKSVGNVLIWEMGEIPSGAAHTIIATVKFNAGVQAPLEVTNRVTATTSTIDASTSNNTSSCTTEIRNAATDPTAHVRISAVLYDGYQLNDADEGIELVNQGSVTMVLDDWELCKVAETGLTCKPLPTITIASYQRVWIARDAAAFARSFGHPPSYTVSSWPGLNNSGDEIILRAPQNEIVDTLIYGSGIVPAPGWQGPALSYYSNHMGSQAGQILARKRDENTGIPIPDTDTAADWIQDTADTTDGRRVLYPGWDLDPLFQPLKVTEAASVTVGIAPDNAFDVIAETLLRAQKTISIEVYTLRHPALIELLAQRARAGVKVSVLLEGSPVGIGAASTEWQTELYACHTLEAAGGQCWFMIHETEDRRFNRYPYLHAKLLIVDDTWVAISSQNLTPDGLPADDKSNGTWGSRGTVVVTNAPSVVERAAEIFAFDLDPEGHNDLLRWNTDYLDRYGPYVGSLIDIEPSDGVSYTVRFPHPLTLNGTYDFELITAPEAALRQSDALLGLVARVGRGDTIYVEQMYEYAAWGVDPLSDPNLRLQAYIAAARRGARVRILLNSRSFIPDNQDIAEESQTTLAYVNALARAEHLDLVAAAGNPTGNGIHNKMVLIDLGDEEAFVHIGSINGSEMANKMNREVALQMKSREAYAYLADLFTYDWWQAHPLHLPLVVQGYVPLHPATHLLISEVHYTGYTTGEWVEVFNPTAHPIDLTGYKIGDAESPDVYEQMFAFPPGTTIDARATMVIAVNGVEVREATFEFYDSDPAIPDMILYPAWGSQDYPFGLRDEGDQVVMLDSDDAPVDVVVWGDKTYPGTTPHAGVIVQGASLERYPPYVDTDDCSSDLIERYPPTPGEVPTAIP